MLTIGLLINPVAGIGGTLAHKGSDDPALQADARAAGATGRGAGRARRALGALGAAAARIRWYTWGGTMGAAVLAESGIHHVVVGRPGSETGGADTVAAARGLRAAGIDLLVFCGGDGTARDVLEAIGQSLPVLGIPAGVKMHSGVFATTPEAAGAILAALADGGLVRATLAEVRDLDEAALRSGEVRPRYYGELKVPEPGGFMQHTKESGRENEGLALEEIVAEVVQRIDERPGLYLLGPGSTLAAVKRALGMEPTLIGIDVLECVDATPPAAVSGTPPKPPHGGKLQIGKDVDAEWLEARLRARSAADAVPATLVLSFTRQQGFLLGRGNLQLTPAVLRSIGRDRLWIVGTRSKLLSLGGRPLLIDTDDPALDRAWSGLFEIITGYDDRMWYRVDCGQSAH